MIAIPRQRPRSSMMEIKKISRGFTVIEVIISLCLLAAMFVIYQLTFMILAANQTTNDQELALRIAESESVNLHGLGYDALPSSGSFSDSMLASLPSGAGNIVVTDLGNNIKQAVITVTWNESRSKSNQAVTLTTLITEGGI
jgi:hypothetical protein